MMVQRSNNDYVKRFTQHIKTVLSTNQHNLYRIHVGSTIPSVRSCSKKDRHARESNQHRQKDTEKKESDSVHHTDKLDRERLASWKMNFT